eukprot:CAMPEP_0181100362 /NCGR_PEP_ID=MMETSP1071-20121207/13153_1 /TAXON_ID=35127 /ORGANISM="Thalassiosira sp., Strain NH16" /LENGTH=167 /DNA_ID=CAMNT_0023183087 /DNA_START=102 /DNA_END=601 /DNA_ORIENTATION=-
MQSLFSLAAIVALHILSKRDYYTSAVVAFQTPSTIPTRLARAVASPVWDRRQQQRRPHVSTSHHHRPRRLSLRAMADDGNNGIIEGSNAAPSSSSEGAASSSSSSSDQKSTTTPPSQQSHNPFKQAYHLYVDYFDRLWSETDVDHRHRLARQRAVDAVTHVRNMVTA